MTIQLTKDTYVAGVLSAAGSQHTLDAQTESYLVHIGAATWVDAAYTQGRFEDAKIEYDSNGVAVGIVGRANEVVGPVWATDASGNVTGLVGPDGQHKNATFVAGLRDVAASSLVFVRDHCYSQIIGDATHDSHHQWFKDHGLYPYTLTINTTGTASPGQTKAMTWAEVAALEDAGVEISNHANRHINSLAQACTGIYLSYTGANATATAYVSNSPRTLNLVDSGTTSFDLTNASYDTLAELKTAVDATPGWFMSWENELDGTERSADLLVNVTPGKDCKNLSTPFALNGGVLVRYVGSTYKVAAVKVYNDSYLMLFGDGCEVAEFNFSNASYDTLTELVAAINALESGAWEARLINNNNTYPVFCNGTEATSGNLLTGDWQDCYRRYVWISAGLPMPSVWRKLLNKAKTVAASNGVTMRNFSDVGGKAWPQAMAHISEFSNLSRCSNVETVIRPGAIPVDVAWVLPNFSTDDNPSAMGSNAQIATIIEALASSPGFVCSMFTHQYKNDGTSGRTFLDQDDLGGGGLWWQYEAKGQALLTAVKTATDALALNTLTQQDFYRLRPSLVPPKNRLFNPKWINSGDTLTGVTDAGYIVPGWKFVTPNITALSISDGVMTIENGSYSLNAKYFQTMVWLKPGRTYEVGISIETLVLNADQTGCSLELAPAYGWEALSLASASSPGSGGVYIHTPDQPGKVVNDHRWMVATLTVPVPTRKPAYIRSRNSGTFDLSTNKNIRLNLNGLGVTSDIDCSSGAGNTAAVHAWEVANAINAAIKASATYVAYPQFHTVARAEGQKVILQMPYASSTSPQQGQIDISAGTSVSAVTTIFGTPVVGTEPPHGESHTGGLQTLVPYLFTVYVNATNTFRLHSPIVAEMEGVF